MSDDALTAWKAYTDDVRSAAIPRTVAYIQQFAQKWAKKSRGQYVCLSPLRPDRHVGSFFVRDDGGWHDFATGEGGDVFSFVERKDGCDFRTAVDTVARYCGLPVWEERRGRLTNGAASTSADELAKLWRRETTDRAVFVALTALIHFCHSAMPDLVRAHLLDHYGLTEEFVDFEKIGWCPPGLWSGRREQFPAIPDETLLATGFFHHASATGAVSPLLAQRIVFPYWKDSLCRYAIGREFHFGRRPDEVTVKDWDKGKYKKLLLHGEKHPYVSPGLVHVLWGEDSVRGPGGRGRVFITEGVTDAAMLRQLGYAVLSPVTIQLRDEDSARAAELLAGASDVVVVNDEETRLDARTKLERHPGLEGAKKIAERLWSARIPVRIGRLPRPEGIEKTDVNEIGRDALRAGGELEARRVFDAVAAAALSYPDFLIEELPPDVGATELGAFMKRLGSVSVFLTELEQEERLLRIAAHAPGHSKRVLAKAFKSARLEAIALLRSKEAPKEAEPEAARAVGPVSVRAAPLGKTDATLLEDFGCYERLDASGGSRRISNFSLTLHRLTASDQGPDWLVCRVLGTNLEVLVEDWAIPPPAWATKRSWIQTFPHPKMQWFGDDNDVQLLGDLLTRGGFETLPRIRATGVLGRHGEGDKLRFVLPAGTLDASGTWMAQPDLIFALDKPSSLTGARRLPVKPTVVDSPAVRALAKRFFEEMPTMHESEGVAIITAWWVSSLFRPELIKQLSAHPILNVHASPGAGKTSLFSRVFWKIFTGVKEGDALSCTSSAFVFAKDLSSTNALGLVFDEFKTGDIGPIELNRFRRILRRGYAGEAEGRGRADQSVNAYLLAAPVAVLGESRLDHDQALVERCAFVLLDGNWIAKHPENRARWDAFKQEPWEQVAPWLQAWSLRADVDQLVRDAKEVTRHTLADLRRTTIPERVVVMLTTIAFGWLATAELARILDAKVAPSPLPTLFRRLLAESLGDDEHGLGERGRNAFDEFLADAAVLANLGLIQPKKHFVFLKGKLCVWVDGIEARRDEWRRSRGSPSGSPGVRNLLVKAREMQKSPTGSYITDVSRRAWLETQIRCVEIDPEKIPASLGIEAFPNIFPDGDIPKPRVEDLIGRYQGDN